MKLIKFFNNLYKYYNSPKGNHDFWDYFKASVIIMLTIATVLVIVNIMLKILSKFN